VKITFVFRVYMSSVGCASSGDVS